MIVLDMLKMVKQIREEISYEKWIEHKANIQVVEKIDTTLDSLDKKEREKIRNLEAYKSEKDIQKELEEIKKTKYTQNIIKQLEQLRLT